MLFILSFKKEWSMSAYVSCGISINISSTEAARFFGNPILSANRSKSSLQGCNVLSYTSLFSISGESPPLLNHCSYIHHRMIYRTFGAKIRRKPDSANQKYDFSYFLNSIKLYSFNLFQLIVPQNTFPTNLFRRNMTFPTNFVFSMVFLFI